MKPLPHVIERTVTIEADPGLVFSFFTESERWAAWWGAGSTIDPRVGGAIKIVHSNGFVTTGEVFEYAPPTRIGFTFSMQYKGEIPAEDSRVTMTVGPHPKGTSVHVHHAVADEALAAMLPQGWRFHLSVFSNAVANVINAAAPDVLREWITLWNEPDEAAREAILRRIAVPNLRYRDNHSNLEGIEEVNLQITAAQKFMGLRVEPSGKVRHCQGTALIDWKGVDRNGKEGGGTNIVTIRDGRIEAVTGVTA